MRRPLGRAREPLFLPGPLDDHVAVTEAQHGARVALLLPQLGDPLFELLVLALERPVELLGQRPHHLCAAIGEAIDLFSDLAQRSHALYTGGTDGHIPRNTRARRAGPRRSRSSGRARGAR